MNPKDLANDLRRRQLRQAAIPSEIIKAASDADLLDSYARCARCGKLLFADPVAAVNNSQNADDFIRLVEMAIAAHQCGDPIRTTVPYDRPLCDHDGKVGNELFFYDGPAFRVVKKLRSLDDEENCAFCGCGGAWDLFAMELIEACPNCTNTEPHQH